MKGSAVRIRSSALGDGLQALRFDLLASRSNRADSKPTTPTEPSETAPEQVFALSLTCDWHVLRMNRMSTIQVRNVPEQLHKQLKVRAAQEGRTLSDYVLDELRVAAGRPTMSQWLCDVDALPPPADAPTPAAEVIADERRR